MCVSQSVCGKNEAKSDFRFLNAACFNVVNKHLTTIERLFCRGAEALAAETVAEWPHAASIFF